MALALRRGWVVATTDLTDPDTPSQPDTWPPASCSMASAPSLPSGRPTSIPPQRWGCGATRADRKATLCAAEHHHRYAPELNIVGVAAGGLTVDPSTTARTFEDVYDGSILSGIPLGGIIGVAREHPEVDLSTGFNPQGQAVVAAADDMTMFQLALTFPLLHWADYLDVPNVLDIPGLRAAFEAHRFGLAAPTAPVYVYHGVLEQNLPIAEADEFVESYRRLGLADVPAGPLR